MMPRQDVEEIVERLRSSVGQFGFYQTLPPCVLDVIPKDFNLNYSPKQIPLDEARFNWMVQNIDVAGTHVFDLGANLGYFSLRLCSTH